MIDAFERAVAAASLGPMRGWKDWIVCVLIGAALVVGVIIGGTAYAAEGDLWLGSPLISRHQDCSKDYNKHNYGVTVDYALDADTRIGGGFYRNSLYRETYYLGAMYTPLHYGRFSAGSFLAFGTGYEPRPQLSLLGSLVLSWEAQHVGVDLLYIPRVTALRLRYAF